MYSDAYVQHLMRGPFPGRVDPWAEAAHYFQQIHGAMIGNFLMQMGTSLLQMGYIASTEASLQIAALRKPDIAITLSRIELGKEEPLDYSAVAAAVLAEPGIAVETDEPELEAIYIQAAGSNELVTVIEIISPRNKTHIIEMSKYQDERSRLFFERGVNVVEVDITRSVKRLFEHRLTAENPYHVAVFIPGGNAHVIVNDFDKPLKRFAVPLRHEGTGIDLQQAYDLAFRQRIIAAQIEHKAQYHEEYLPFPSLLTDSQREAALEAVREWHNTLKQLKEV
jgi:Protein of unknown function (DUF4058)